MLRSCTFFTVICLPVSLPSRAHTHTLAHTCTHIHIHTYVAPLHHLKHTRTNTCTIIDHLILDILPLLHDWFPPPNPLLTTLQPPRLGPLPTGPPCISQYCMNTAHLALYKYNLIEYCLFSVCLFFGMEVVRCYVTENFPYAHKSSPARVPMVQ